MNHHHHETLVDNNKPPMAIGCVPLKHVSGFLLLALLVFTNVSLHHQQLEGFLSSRSNANTTTTTTLPNNNNNNNNSQDPVCTVDPPQASLFCQLPSPPLKYEHSVVRQNLMHPELYDSNIINASGMCQYQPVFCQRARKAQKVFRDFEAAPPPQRLDPSRVTRIAVPARAVVTDNGNNNNNNNHNSNNNNNNITAGQQLILPQVRVLMNVPDWYYRHKNNKPEWDALREGASCFGLPCDVQFGEFRHLTTTNYSIRFHQWPPKELTWKPNVYLQRLGQSNRGLWENHGIAHVLESGESCGGTECQYNPSSLRAANPATILAAMTQGQVMSLVIDKRRFQENVLDKTPPTVTQFANVTEYSGLFVSNCGDTALERGQFLRALMTELPLASYGTCPHQTPGKTCKRRKCSKIDESGRYPFAIAIENQPVLPGYMTEKPWEAFLSNALPVLWTAPNVQAFLPHHSFINVQDFASPRALATYLKHVRATPDLYQSYFAWRNDPDQVARLLRQLDVAATRAPHIVCGVCHTFLKEFVG